MSFHLFLALLFLNVVVLNDLIVVLSRYRPRLLLNLLLRNLSHANDFLKQLTSKLLLLLLINLDHLELEDANDRSMI